MRILIVDDRQELYNVFTDLMKKNYPAIEIESAIDGIMAHGMIKKDRQNPFDIVILDEQMGGPDKDGTALLRKIKSDHLPVENIIFVTGYYSEIPAHIDRDANISLFIEKSDEKFSEMLYKAVLMFINEHERNNVYDTAALFGKEFYKCITDEINDLITRETNGYEGVKQQKLVGTVIRSYMKWCCEMNREYSPDNALNASVFFVEALCGVFGIQDELVNVIRKFMDFEEILYSIPRYRDHFFHQIKVFLLGFCIINRLNREKLLSTTLLGSKEGMKLWFITAMFHDIGYPFEKIRLWLNSYINGVLKSKHDRADSEIIPLHLDFGTLLSHGSHSFHVVIILEKLFRLYDIKNEKAKAALLSCFMKYVTEKPDHGIFSALILMNLLEMDEIDSIALAVALHNAYIFTEVSYTLPYKMSLEKDSLSFMLMFCDLAQDWGRSRLFSNTGNKFGEPEFSGLTFEHEGKSDFLKVKLRYDRELSFAEETDWRENIYNKYISPLEGCWQVSKGGSLKLSVSYSHSGKTEPMREIEF